MFERYWTFRHCRVFSLGKRIISVTAAPQPIGASRTLPGSVSAAVASYYGSLAFRDLAQSTQYMRRCYLEKFREQHGDKSIATMPPDFIVRMLDKLEPFAAKNFFKVLRALMQHAVATGLCKADPTQGVKIRTPKTDGIHAWSDAEIAQYESHHAIGTKARLAMALALYTGQRRGDLIRMGRRMSAAARLRYGSRRPGQCWRYPCTLTCWPSWKRRPAST